MHSEKFNGFVSVHPSVSLSKLFCLNRLTFVCNQWAYADNCADAVDQLLLNMATHCHTTTRVYHAKSECVTRFLFHDV